MAKHENVDSELVELLFCLEIIARVNASIKVLDARFDKFFFQI